jgi:proton-coupled amino acid transporter
MLLLPQTQRALRSQQQQQQQQPRSYGELGRQIMGPHGEFLVNICLGISQAGFATAYIIFIAANLYNIAAIPRAWTCLFCIPGLAGLVQFRDMKHLSSFSLLANISNFGALLAVLMQDYKVFRSDQQNHDDEPMHAVRWSGFLYIIAITIYAMEGAGMILSLEASCKERTHFPWLLRFTLALISIFMCLFGTAGYAAFGEHTLAPVTLNLGDDHFWAATFVKCALCLGKCHSKNTNRNFHMSILQATKLLLIIIVWFVIRRSIPYLSCNDVRFLGSPNVLHAPII